jgi:hypothetical protein
MNQATQVLAQNRKRRRKENKDFSAHVLGADRTPISRVAILPYIIIWLEVFTSIHEDLYSRFQRSEHAASRLVPTGLICAAIDQQPRTQNEFFQTKP